MICWICFWIKNLRWFLLNLRNGNFFHLKLYLSLNVIYFNFQELFFLFAKCRKERVCFYKLLTKSCIHSVLDIFVIGAKRTAFGTYGGKLKNYTPTDLGEIAARAALKNASISPENVDHVVFGNTLLWGDGFFLPAYADAYRSSYK